MTYKLPPKDPSDNIDCAFDFTKVLGTTETISSGTVISDKADLTVASVSANGKKVTFRLSGGAEGRYVLTCQIQTSDGNTINRKASLEVRDL